MDVVNSYLNYLNLDIIKIYFIFSAFVFFYILRAYVYNFIYKNIDKIGFLQNYSKDILEVSKKPITWIMILLNIQITFYIYNNYKSFTQLELFFDIFHTLFVTILVYKILNTVIGIKLQTIDSSKVKNEVVNISIKIVNFVLMLIGLLIILYFLGVDLTAVLSGLGIGGLAFALAAKDSLANFFGTLSILFSDSFSQGDWIAINGVEGTVVEIGLRATKIRTFDNAMLTMPNQTLANGEIKNWNKRVLGRRIKMNLGIKYDSKLSDIKNTISDIKEMLHNHPNIATKNSTHNSKYHSLSAKLISVDDVQGVKKTLLVFLDEFSDSSINILVYCFSKTVNWDEWLAVKEDLMYKIMQIFENNNIEFAFPSLSIYKEKVDFNN